MLRFIGFALLLLLPFLTKAQVTSDPEKAFQWSHESGRPVLLVFEGSDWCLSCIRLDRKVLSADVFVAFADKNLVVLKADFPQKKKIEPVLQKQYEALADAFNKQGDFPKMILVNAAQKEIANVRTDFSDAGEFISHIEQLLKHYHEEM